MLSLGWGFDNLLKRFNKIKAKLWKERKERKSWIRIMQNVIFIIDLKTKLQWWISQLPYIPQNLFSSFSVLKHYPGLSHQQGNATQNLKFHFFHETPSTEEGINDGWTNDARINVIGNIAENIGHLR